MTESHWPRFDETLPFSEGVDRCAGEAPAMRLLVTGGAGYIGSVVVAELLRAGHDVDSGQRVVKSTPGFLRLRLLG